jgi:hypothetical protein
MVTNNILMKFGFSKDENNLQLKKIFQNNLKLKEVHIDIYPDNPMISSSEFMLLLRTIEYNSMVSNNDDRLILKRNDKYKTYFMNVLFSSIKECFFKECENNYEFIIKIQNIYYKIIVFN